MRLRHGDRLRGNLWESHRTATHFDLDDEPVLAAESGVAAAICSHQVVMQRGDALTADMLDEFHGFVQEELAALLEEKNAEIAYLRAIANGKFADAAQMRLHHAGLEEDKTFVFITAHLAAQFKAIGATNYVQIEVNHEELGPLTLTIQRQRGSRRFLPIGHVYPFVIHRHYLLSACDGKRVVTASWDGTARIWDAESGREIAVLKGHMLSSAAFSGDGKRVVTASWDGTTRIWDAESGTEIAVLK